MREYKNRSIVSGLSVSDVLNKQPSELENMSESDLRKVVGRLVSAGNKRLRTFEKSGEKSPAYNSAMSSGGNFSTRGKDKEGLLLEFMRAKIFFSSETSTVKSWRKVKTETAYKMNIPAPKIDSDGEYEIEDISDYSDYDYMSGKNPFSRDIWAMVDKIHQINPVVANANNKYKIAGIIADMAMDNPKVLKGEEYVFSVYQEIIKREQEMEALNEQFDKGVSGFFQ